MAFVDVPSDDDNVHDGEDAGPGVVLLLRGVDLGEQPPHPGVPFKEGTRDAGRVQGVDLAGGEHAGQRPIVRDPDHLDVGCPVEEGLSIRPGVS